MLLTLGNGTASSEMLDYFGMESREKIVIFTVVTWESWRHVKGQMEQKLNIDVPGTGISFLIPVSSVGGGKALRYLLAGQEYEKEEESELKNTEYELLIVISNYGYNNLVMEAAREAGAGGGTVVHARGTGRERAEKFFGAQSAAGGRSARLIESGGRRGILAACRTFIFQKENAPRQCRGAGLSKRSAAGAGQARNKFRTVRGGRGAAVRAARWSG